MVSLMFISQLFVERRIGSCIPCHSNRADYFECTKKRVQSVLYIVRLVENER